VLAQGELLSPLGAAYLASGARTWGWCDAPDWLDAARCPTRALVDAAGGELPGARPMPGSASASLGNRRACWSQGFIARHGDGGRGLGVAAPTSARILIALLSAAREIWTDDAGCSRNPASSGRAPARGWTMPRRRNRHHRAKVLHPRSIAPCRDANVPMRILATGRPDLPGTRIDSSAATVPGVKAISRRDGIVLVSMESIGMWQQVGFLADIFERFKRHGLSVDLIGRAVSVTLDAADVRSA
jgi:diaminopimelate decarboxylase/aspartate kinase